MPAELEIHWLYLAAVAAMLWFPRQWLRLGLRLFKRRHRHRDKVEQFADNKARDPDDKSVRLGAEFKNKRNYIDFARAAAGAYCLVAYAFSLSGPSEEGTTTILILQAFVCLMGVLIQSVRREQKLSFFAAIFYLVGLSAGLCGYAAIMAFLLVLAINPVLPNPRVFIATYASFLLPFGYFFGSTRALLIVTFILLALIPVISLMAKKPMVIYAKKLKVV